MALKTTVVTTSIRARMPRSPTLCADQPAARCISPDGQNQQRKEQEGRHRHHYPPPESVEQAEEQALLRRSSTPKLALLAGTRRSELCALSPLPQQPAAAHMP